VIQFVGFNPPPGSLHKHLWLIIFIFEECVKGKSDGFTFLSYFVIAYFDNFISKFFAQSNSPTLDLSGYSARWRRTQHHLLTSQRQHYKQQQATQVIGVLRSDLDLNIDISWSACSAF
jgi:hypothetical protein